MTVFQQGKHRLEDGRTAIDGEHPEGGLSDKRQFAPSQRAKSGEGDLHTPSDRAALDKIADQSVMIFRTIKKR